MKFSFDRRRKFAVAVLALVMTFILALVGIVDGGNWVAAVGLIVGLYSGSEAVEGGMHARADR